MTNETIKNNINIKNTNIKTNTGMSLCVVGNVNSHFINNYEDLPDCPLIHV